MKASSYILSWVLTLASPLGWAASSPTVPANPQLRLDVRDALQAQRLAGQAAERREEAAAGRRLTEAERAHLREQLRQQWAVRGEAEAATGVMPVKVSNPLPVGAGAMAATATATVTTGAAIVGPPGAEATGTPRGANH